MKWHLVFASISTMVLVGCSEPKPPAPTPTKPSTSETTMEVSPPVEPAPVQPAVGVNPLPVVEPSPPVGPPKSGTTAAKQPAVESTEPAEPSKPSSARAVGNAFRRAFGGGP